MKCFSFKYIKPVEVEIDDIWITKYTPLNGKMDEVILSHITLSENGKLTLNIQEIMSTIFKIDTRQYPFNTYTEILCLFIGSDFLNC